MIAHGQCADVHCITVPDTHSPALLWGFLQVHEGQQKTVVLLSCVCMCMCSYQPVSGYRCPAGSFRLPYLCLSLSFPVFAVHCGNLEHYVGGRVGVGHFMKGTPSCLSLMDFAAREVQFRSSFRAFIWVNGYKTNI